MVLRPLAFWDCGFESRRGHGWLSVLSVVYCQVEVSVSGGSLVRRSPTECGVSECDREASIIKITWPTRLYRVMGRKKCILWNGTRWFPQVLHIHGHGQIYFDVIFPL